MTTAPDTAGVQEYDQLVVPVATFHVVPPSTEISTSATTPPTSEEVPEIVTLLPAVNAALLRGEAMTDVGAVISVGELELKPPLCMVAGITPISANKLIVACCIRASSEDEPLSCSPSKPQLHCTVPAPNTSAPLLWR